MKIAFFGTGLMGAPMAQRLLEAGLEVAVYNRSPKKTEPLRKQGAVIHENPAEAAKNADVLIAMLADYAAICHVFFDPADASGSSNRLSMEGKTFIQMGTIAAAESLELQKKVEQAGGQYMEAPVLGSIPQVKAGELIILVGGTKDQYEKYADLLSHFGEQRFYIGEVGQGAAVKLALNQLIASLTAAFSMSLGYLREKNANIDVFMDILRQSAIYAPTFDKKFSKMMDRDFSNPNFPLKLLLKDVGLMLEEFENENIHATPLEGLRKILEEGNLNGDGELDYSALYNSIHPKN